MGRSQLPEPPGPTPRALARQPRTRCTSGRDPDPEPLCPGWSRRLDTREEWKAYLRVAQEWWGVGIALEPLPYPLPVVESGYHCFSGLSLTLTWGFDYPFILIPCKKVVGLAG